jgi:Nif-specific regulatory protein
MLSTEQKRLAKRVVLLAAGLFALLHCMAVFLYVARQPWTGLYVFSGQRIATMDGGSSAYLQGIRPGDRVLSISGREVTNPVDVIRITPKLPKGEAIPVVYRTKAGLPETAYIKIVETPFPVKLLLWMICTVIVVTTGYIFHYRRSDDDPTTLFCVMCILFSVTFMDAFAWEVVAGNMALLIVFIISSALLAPVTLHFFLTYPETSPLVRRVRLISKLIYLPSLVYMVAVFVHVIRIAGMRGTGESHAASMAQALETLLTLVVYQLTVTFAYCIASIISLWHCQRTTLHIDVKNQIKWVWWGVATALIPLIMIGLLLDEGIAKNIFGQFQFWAMSAMLAVLVATGLSLLKYRLMYVDTILNRWLGYVLVSGLMIVIYFGAVGIASLIMSQVTGEISRMPFLISVLAIALFFRPVSDWVQKVVDRRFYRERYQFQQAVYDTSQAILRTLDLDLLLRQLMDTIMDSLHVKRGAVLLWETEERRVKVAVARGYLESDSQLTVNPQDPLFELIARTRGPLTARDLHERNWNSGEYTETIARMVKMHAEAAIPIIHEDEVLGLFILGRKQSRQIYSSEDVRLLMTLANHAAVAIHNARTYRKMETLNVNLQSNIGKIEEQRREILGLQQQLLSENVYLKEEIGEKYNFQDIIGTSSRLQQVLETVKKVAPSASAVLIRGESGVGKELIARAIHFNSPRRDKPFVRVNCAVLSENLLESELFGHEKGAFTGAVAERAGRFEVADSGTIFLDEIGDISPHTQVKLMRVLQEKEFERVGSNQTRTVDVRVVAATNRDLEDLMSREEFREDLFYRLNVISIEMPPLRDRREDIFPLAVHFLNKYARVSGKPICGIDPEVLELFKSYHWPGNVRELENLIERAVVLADGATLTVRDFPIQIAEHKERLAGNGGGALNQQLEMIEIESLKGALKAANGNKSRAAKNLGLARSTFISKLKKWDMA